MSEADGVRIQEEIRRQVEERLQGYEEQIYARVVHDIQTTPPPPPTYITHKGPDLRPSKPAKFRGDRSDLQEVSVWLFGVVSYFEASRVTEEKDRVVFAVAMLEGPAQSWWMSVKLRSEDGSGPVAPCTWNAFDLLLTARFQSINAGRVARDKLYTLRQQNTVCSYASIFQQLLLKCPEVSSPVDHVHRFVFGLKPHIQKELRLRPPSTLDEAISMAESIDSSTFSSRSYFGGSSSGPSPMELGVVRVEGPPESENDVGNDRERRISELQCELTALQGVRPFGGTRPWSRVVAGRPAPRPWNNSRPPQQKTPRRLECDAKRLCFKCMRPGHSMADCTSEHREWRPKGDALPV